jgi:hypothetical protein
VVGNESDDNDDDDANKRGPAPAKPTKKTTVRKGRGGGAAGAVLPPPPPGNYSRGPGGVLIPLDVNMPSDDDEEEVAGGGGAMLKRKASRSLSSADNTAYGGADASLHPGALPTRPADEDGASAEMSPSMRLLTERAAKGSAASVSKPRLLTQRQRDDLAIDARLRDPTRMMTVFLNADQVRERVANGSLDASKVRPVPGSAGRFVT